MSVAGYFISATGTDAGKTLLTAALVCQLLAKGKQAQAVKPVLSGFEPAQLAESDTGVLLAAQGRPVTLAEADVISPWRYARPVSPHLAGQGDASLTAEAITAFCQAQLAQEGITLIEGAGGIMSPLVQGFTQAQLVQTLQIPVVLVAGCYLGSISHTLTAVEAMQARGIRLASIVVSDAPESTVDMEETRESIASHVDAALQVFTLPRISPKTASIWQHVPPITEVLNHG